MPSKRTTHGHRFIDLTNQTFGYWTVIQCAGPRKFGPKQHERIMWECQCVCGQIRTVSSNDLRRGKSISCGCSSYRLGPFLSELPEYDIWGGIKSRCLNPRYHAYPYYGGRGITLCDRWRDSFTNFYADMGPRPSPQHSIDRTDNEKGYFPENCRWSTSKEQARNTRRTRLVTFQGLTLCVSEMAKHHGFTPQQIINRLHKGWTIERALTTPIKK